MKIVLGVPQRTTTVDCQRQNQEQPAPGDATEYKSDRRRPHLPPATDNLNRDEPAVGHDACGRSEHDSAPPTVRAEQATRPRTKYKSAGLYIIFFFTGI